MNLYSISLLAFFVGSCYSLIGDLEYDSKLNIGIEHAISNLADPQFIYRGEIAIKSLHSSSIYIEQMHLNDELRKKILRLAEENGFYRVRATVKYIDGRQTQFLTFVQACSLLESQLSDIISVHLDHSGNVIDVSISTASSCSGEPIVEFDVQAFNTTVYIRHMEIGPIPDTASYIQKLEREKEAKERGDTKDNRSFFSKYWMYIVPVVIFVVLSGAVNPEGQR